MGCKTSKLRSNTHERQSVEKKANAQITVEGPSRDSDSMQNDKPRKSSSDKLSSVKGDSRQSTDLLKKKQASDGKGLGSIDPGMFITQQRGSFSDRYLREKKLGSGAYGEVLLCREKATLSERAVKVIKKTDLSANQLSQNPISGNSWLEEVTVVKQLDHPNIMKLYEVFEDKRNYYMVMEVYRGGELFDEIINRQKFSEIDAASLVQQILSGVTYLHKHRIVHRDLKPENVLFESKAKDALIKIVDFGLSAYFDPRKKMRERLGTAYYIAPEVLRQKYDEKCDIWSIGVILYILLCGYPPFGGRTDKEILQKVEKGKFHFHPSEWSNITNSAKDLITRMLTLDASKRISAEEALAHPFIQQAGIKDRDHISSPLLSNALGNMRKFQASQKLAQAALLFMGSKLTTLEETKELTRIFRSLDVNGDGQLDRKELIEGYSKLLKIRGEEVGPEIPQNEIEKEVNKILESVDFDKSGYIEYSEFVTVAMDKKILLSRDRLRVAFNLFDVDGNGTIAADELRRILGDVDDEAWNAIIREVDKNNDGEVDFDEFAEMMQKICLDKELCDPKELEELAEEQMLSSDF